MLSQKLVFPESKNFTSDNEIPTTPIVPINHYLSRSINQRKRDLKGLISLSHANVFEAIVFKIACFEHPNFFKVNELE